MTTTYTSVEADLPVSLRLVEQYDYGDPEAHGNAWKVAVCNELRNQYAELTTLRAKIKTYEDLGEAGSDVQLLRMGYAAARLEIESLRKEHDELAVAYREELDKLSQRNYELRQAPYVQAPAQPAPAHKDSTPELPIGDSAFESWYSTYSPVHKSDKQRARDAYAAGMGDSLVVAAPAAVAGPSEAVAYLDIGAGGYLDLGTDLTDEALSRLPKGRHALVVAGTYGIDGYIAAPTAQPAPRQEAQEHVEIPAKCPYFGPSPHRDVWLEGWYAASQEGKSHE